MLLGGLFDLYDSILRPIFGSSRVQRPVLPRLRFYLIALHASSDADVPVHPLILRFGESSMSVDSIRAHVYFDSDLGDTFGAGSLLIDPDLMPGRLHIAGDRFVHLTSLDVGDWEPRQRSVGIFPHHLLRTSMAGGYAGVIGDTRARLHIGEHAHIVDAGNRPHDRLNRLHLFDI